MFSTILGTLTCALALYIASAETKALLTACKFMEMYDGSFKNKMKLLKLRYYFHSVLFVEVYAAKRHVQPVYRTSRVIALSTITTVIASATNHAASFEQFAMLGVVVGVVYFLSAYGPAFFAHRDLVASLTALGKPLLFA